MITRYEDITVGTYDRLMEIATDTGLDANGANLATLAVLTGKTEDELLDEPIEEFRRQMDAAGFLLVYPKAAQIRDAYELGGTTYKPTTQERKMTAGQFLDFQTYAQMPGERWAEFCSVLLVPEGKTYGKDYDILDVQEAVRDHLCILDAIALRAFFLASSASLLARSRSSSERMEKAMGVPKETRRRRTREALKTAIFLRRSGGGFPALTWWLKLPDALGMR